VLRQCVMWSLMLLAAGAPPALAQSRSGSRWALHGEMGVARAARRFGVAVGVGPSVRIARATVSGWVDGLFTGSIALDSLQVDGNQLRCGQVLYGDDSGRNSCLGRSELNVGGLIEATVPLDDQGPLRVGVGYRLGLGRGPAAIVAFDKEFRNSAAISVTARAGERFLSLRVGAKLTP